MHKSEQPWFYGNYIINLQYNERINEVFDQYRIKLTGSLECKNEPGIFDFIYREQPDFCSEILYILYQQGYEDGRLAERGRQRKRKSKKVGRL